VLIEECRGARRQSRDLRTPRRYDNRSRAIEVARADNQAMSSTTAPTFRPLSGIYEPSAVQQLPDGRFLVVEDERRRPFSTFTVSDKGEVRSAALTRSFFQMFSSFWELDDLEGLASDKRGFVYAITSHSRDDAGNEKKTRERLVRFRVKGNQVTDTKVVEDLKQRLTARHPVLAAAAKVRDVKGSNGLNIEALAISEDQSQMLIGFRSPLVDGRAIVCSLQNYVDVFDSDASPVIAPVLEELDLGGFGIRGLSYVPAINEYMVIGGPASKADEPCGLFRWRGPGSSPVRVTIPGLKDFAHAEGVSAANIANRQCVVVVSDDGDRKTKRDANFVLFETALLESS
jgi:Protein of unknown function (DUF3616)